VKAWWTAREWAEMRLPGLPVTESALIRRAKRENWPHRPRAGSGGGREYHVKVLPLEARLELLRRSGEERIKNLALAHPALPKAAPIRAVHALLAHMSDVLEELSSLEKQERCLREARASLERMIHSTTERLAAFDLWDGQ